MVDYKERMKKAIKKREKPCKTKEDIEHDAEIFFENNKLLLVKITLTNFTSEMERDRFKNQFEAYYNYDNYIYGESETYKEVYAIKLISLIKENLTELSPDFCNYNVTIPGGISTMSYDKIEIKITMNIKKIKSNL